MSKTVTPPDARLEAVFAEIDRRLRGLERAPGTVFTGALVFYPKAISGSGLVEVKPGWYFCNGATFDGDERPELADFLGGTTLPDYRDRVLVAAGTTFTNVGAAGGAIEVTLTTAELPVVPDHDHPVSVTINADNATHGHGNKQFLVPGGGAQMPGPGSGLGDQAGVDSANATHTHTASAVVAPAGGFGGGQPHENMPPYRVVGGVLIKY